MNKGSTHTPEAREKMRVAHTGMPLSPEARAKVRAFQLGHHASESARANMSAARKGVRLSEAHRANLSTAHMGHRQGPEVIKQMRVRWTGENNPKWKGGITPEAKRIRRSIEYRLWRDAVFSRDNWTCQECGERGGRIHAHHILGFADAPTLRTAIDNGITFCGEHHRQLHSRQPG